MSNELNHEAVKTLNSTTITPAQFRALSWWECSAHHVDGCAGGWSAREGACSCGLMHAREILSAGRPECGSEDQGHSVD